MNNNQEYVTGKPGPEINETIRLNGDLKIKNSRNIVNDIDKKSDEDPLLLHIREMEIINNGLVDLLDQRTRELEEFVAATNRSLSVIGHDVRSPVCTVLAALELLKQKLERDYPLETEQYIEIASDSAKSTLNLLDKLLEWSVSKNKCATFNPVKINLHEFLKDELGKVRSPITLKTLTVDYSVAPGLNVSGDIQMIRSIFRNLISNAINFSDDGGKIEIKAVAAGRLVEITFSDNGSGISSELQKSILENDAGIFKSPGIDGKVNGVGLLLCKEFIESHGGVLQITSKPDRGSKFKFSLERID